MGEEPTIRSADLKIGCASLQYVAADLKVGLVAHLKVRSYVLTRRQVLHEGHEGTKSNGISFMSS